MNNSEEGQGKGEICEHEAWIYETNNWHTISKSEIARRNECKELPKQFGIVTFNVWFSSEDFVIRFKALMERLKRIKVDQPLEFICFQEVTPEFVNLLKREEWIQREYYCSDMGGKTITPYGVFMIIHYSIPLIRFVEHILPSNLKGRKLLIAELAISRLSSHNNNNNNSNRSEERGTIWKVGSVHLDSKDNQEIRRLQLDNISSTMSDNHCYYQLLAGDYNIDGFSIEQEEINQRTSHLADAWLKLRHLDSSAYTKVRKQQRYDRILYTPQTISPLSIERIGYHPIYFEGPNAGKELGRNVFKGEEGHPTDAIHPSDHCGLFATFRVNS